MGNGTPQHRRIRVRSSGLPFEGLYDSVIDSRLHALLDAVRLSGIDVGVRALCGNDGRLIARELATVVMDALEARLDAQKPATAADIAVVNRLLAVLRESDEDAHADLAELLPLVLERSGPMHESKPPDLSAHETIWDRHKFGSAALARLATRRTRERTTSGR